MTYFGSYLTPWDPPRGGFEGFSQILSKGTRDSREGPSQEASQPGGSWGGPQGGPLTFRLKSEGYPAGRPPRGVPARGGPIEAYTRIWPYWPMAIGAYSRDMALLALPGVL
jgi:hypothetical protein